MITNSYYRLSRHLFTAKAVPWFLCFVISASVFTSTVLVFRLMSSTIDDFGNDHFHPPVRQANVGPKQRRIFTVFSTECSKFHDWQSQTLLYSHEARRIEGELVRLLSCDRRRYEVPRHSHSRYRVVRTPNFDKLVRGDAYSPRNKANALSHWLHNRSDDADLPRDDDIVVLVDPDHIFLDRFDVSAVRPGVGIAAKYQLGGHWIKNWALPFCDGKCDELEDGYDPSYGVPQILTAGDTRRHADLWKNLTEELRQAKKPTGQLSWMTEMFSCILAARRLGIRFEVQRMMVSNADSDNEPWDRVRWRRSPSGEGFLGGSEAAAPVAHYCQVYKISTFSWWKHEHRNFDLRACDRSRNFPSPSGAVLEAMAASRNKSLTVSNLPLDGKMQDSEAIKRSRNVWLLDNTWGVARQAFDAYYEEFCPT